MSIKTADAAKIFKSLSDTNRLAIVLSLVDGEKSAKELLGGVDFLQPTLSHHLSILCESGTLIARRDGKNVYYRINPKTAEDAAEILKTLSSASSAASAPAQKVPTVKAVKRAPVRETKKEPKIEKPVPPKEEEQPVRRSQVFDFFD